MARAMKDSGIEWIGEIPENWQVGRIGQLYTERREKVSDTEYQPLSVTMKGILPQLSTAAKTDAHDDRKLVRIGDFAINSRSDRRGSCGISPYEGSVSLINTILMPRNEMHPVYYNWLFHSTMFSDEFYIWGHGIVDDLWTTNWQDMKRIAVPMPPFEEQSRIADYLDTECAKIDAVIEQTRASIEEYKKLKQSVITEAVTKGIRPGRKMKGGGVEWIDVIPEAWSMERGKGLFVEVDNRSTDGSEELLTVSQYTGVTPRSQKNVNMFEAETLEGYKICEVGDIAANTMWLWAGAIGVSNYRGVISPSYNIYRQKGDHYDSTYLDYLLRASPLVQHYESLSTGIRASRLRLYPQQFLSIRYPVPPMEEQKEIVSFLKEKIDGMDSLIQKKEQYLAEIESYKKSLIFEYVTGKKEVV